jgi:hypothetical protein
LTLRSLIWKVPPCHSMRACEREDPRVVDAVGGLRAAAEHRRQVRAGEGAAAVEPGEADAVGFGRRDGALEGGRRHALAEAARLETVDLHRLLAAAQLQPREQTEAAAVLAVQAVDDLLRAQGLVVAGAVEQARRHVDGVAEAVAVDLHDLAVGHRHLQLERGQSGPATARGVGDDTLERFVHVVGGLDAAGRAVEHRHQASLRAS